jgi:hypothetical protein
MLSLSIVGVDCVMDAMVYLVTSIRQSMWNRIRIFFFFPFFMLLDWILEWSVCRWNMWIFPDFVFLLNPPTSALNVHAIVNGFNEDVIPSFLPVMSTLMMTSRSSHSVVHQVVKFTPTQGRIMKYPILILQIRATFVLSNLGIIPQIILNLKGIELLRFVPHIFGLIIFIFNIRKKLIWVTVCFIVYFISPK